MCGIAVAADRARVERMLDAVAHRGPDARGVARAGEFWLGHVRLAIVDLDSRSDQPWKGDGVVMSYNGETWNWRALREKLGGTWTTEGDTEVVARTLGTHEPSDALSMLEGMMAVAWVDSAGTLRVARDRFGEVPVWIHPEGAACSELKGLRAAGFDPTQAVLLPPGSYAKWTRAERWWVDPYYEGEGGTDDERSFREVLEDATEERAMSDVPVCVLLSGGLDSAVTAALLSKLVPDLTAYTAVMDERSKDLAMARLVAEHLGIRLVEVEVPVPEKEDLREVVRVIEQSSKAQVEIGWPCLHLARVMKSDGFKVTYSGEGADELMGSYGPWSRSTKITKLSIPMYAKVKKFGWKGARKRMTYDQHRKNFLRANNVFMSQGVECRLPWLHRPIVERILGMTLEEVRSNGRAKGCVEEAVADLLPAEVLGRSKLAFQDGLGIKPIAEDVTRGSAKYYRLSFAELYGSAHEQHDLFGGGG